MLNLGFFLRFFVNQAPEMICTETYKIIPTIAVLSPYLVKLNVLLGHIACIA